MLRKILALSLVVTITLFLGCGKNDDSSSSNPFSIAAPVTALTSPTASSSTASASVWGRFTKASFAFMQFTGIRVILKYMGFNSSVMAADDTSAPTDVKPFTEMKNELRNDIGGAPADVAAKIGSFETKTFGANCFNQTHNVTGENGTVNVLFGDGGIAYATASGTDTTACIAAYMNALVVIIVRVVKNSPLT